MHVAVVADLRGEEDVPELGAARHAGERGEDDRIVVCDPAMEAAARCMRARVRPLVENPEERRRAHVVHGGDRVRGVGARERDAQPADLSGNRDAVGRALVQERPVNERRLRRPGRVGRPVVHEARERAHVDEERAGPAGALHVELQRRMVHVRDRDLHDVVH